MADVKDYADKVLTQIKDGNSDSASLTLQQAYNDLNPHKFKEVIDKMTAKNPEIKVTESENYKDVKNFPKTIKLDSGYCFIPDKTLFHKK
jgi:hypothetical protein